MRARTDERLLRGGIISAIKGVRRHFVGEPWLLNPNLKAEQCREVDYDDPQRFFLSVLNRIGHDRSKFAEQGAWYAMLKKIDNH